ncbi:MAG: HPF/RaiA family ribosome-associated protein [Planctomycetes bacterium]|nr:HPF/RaiA family ribosome-associated protein [Planctomycetota bacterium]
MDIVVSFKDRAPCERLAWYARRALGSALDRFAARIRDVTVRIRDENGAKGGVDQHCSIAMRVDGGQELHLHDIDATPESALHRLARRAARLVRERLARRRIGRDARR